ncbi:unnamed protein product [Arabis nemorensis]|uniref:Uncharacterized protein n=1 Tax=Arabis nemorensis TaxID=586526 RepID=A0A565B884_9BRAS|nr:unnamed protein product [Arabis nemorensis]
MEGGRNREKLVRIREEILKKRRCGKLPGDKHHLCSQSMVAVSFQVALPYCEFSLSMSSVANMTHVFLQNTPNNFICLFNLLSFKD